MTLVFLGTTRSLLPSPLTAPFPQGKIKPNGPGMWRLSFWKKSGLWSRIVMTIEGSALRTVQSWAWWNVASVISHSPRKTCSKYTSARACPGDRTRVTIARNLSPNQMKCARMLSLTLTINHLSAVIARAHLQAQPHWTITSVPTQVNDHFSVRNAANLLHKHHSSASINEFHTSVRSRTYLTYLLNLNIEIKATFIKYLNKILLLRRYKQDLNYWTLRHS